MEKTKIENHIYMHKQKRNVHGFIFGGYLMRECVEISFISTNLLVLDLGKDPEI